MGFECAICYSETANTSRAILPCCERKESSVQFCLPCIETICQPSAGARRRCPRCNQRYPSAIAFRNSVRADLAIPPPTGTPTLTAAERKRIVVACRALRAPISRFEDAFAQLHGRPPKGAADRAPLAYTYAQYREWKRMIRADAACRIQALARGARTRWALLRNNDPRASRVVMARAGRQALSNRSGPQTAGQDSVLNQLSFSNEIEELHVQKLELKNQLRQYDTNFASRHGRMPVKAEKEPIRHLYEKYNALKSQISAMENETSRPGVFSPVSLQQPPLVLSPVSATDSGVATRNPPGSLSAPSVAPSQDLATLKAEQKRLHQMLRSYEKDFRRENQRQVSCFADIRPVASQYRRYKEIKKTITAIQQAGER